MRHYQTSALAIYRDNVEQYRQAIKTQAEYRENVKFFVLPMWNGMIIDHLIYDVELKRFVRIEHDVYDEPKVKDEETGYYKTHKVITEIPEEIG